MHNKTDLAYTSDKFNAAWVRRFREGQSGTRYFAQWTVSNISNQLLEKSEKTT